MRRLMATALVASLSMGLAACGGSPASNTTTAGTTGASAAEVSDPAKKEAKSTPAYTLMFGHTLTENDTFHVYMEKWADDVYKDTEGDVKIEIYPNGTLGSEEDVLEQMRQGANVGWQTDFARAGSYVPELGVVNCPYFIESMDEVEALQGSTSLNNWFEKLNDDYSLKALSFDWVQGNRVVFSNKEAKNPKDMEKMSIRAANAPSWIASVNSLGCTAVALAYSEVYSSIQTKVVDGCELPYNAALNLAINEVCKNIIETNHIYQMNLMLISSGWWDSLPEEYQKIMIDDCNKQGKEASDELAKMSEQSKQTMVDNGMKLIPYEDLDIDAFKAASGSAYEELGLSDARSAVYADIGKEVVQ